MNLNIKQVKILTLGLYLIMILVNAAANTLPINGITTGQVSDFYSNIFAPAGITFAIWGLIYLLLGIFTVFQLFTADEKSKMLKPVNIMFMTSSVVNSIWIIAWHYQTIWLTVILMLTLLFSLIRIADLIKSLKLDKKDKLIIKIPFGIYFGWITIATIANMTVLFVSIGWKNLIVPDYVWMIIILMVGVVIFSLRMIKDENLAYGLVSIWAYIGILIKHTSISGFNYLYPRVIYAVVICIALLLLANAYLIKTKKVI